MIPVSEFTIFIFALIALTNLACAHTWIDQLNVISPNGTFIGDAGFSRGYVPRSSTSPKFGDGLMTNLMPPNGRVTGNQILSTDPICMPSQQTQTQTDGSPRLQAVAGSAIALRYQENGHVTLPENQPGKPENRGTVFVYGTTQPSASDTLLAIHKVWNADQTGGDKRGVLLSSQNFDDGRCYQANESPTAKERTPVDKTNDPLMGINLWCQQDIALPTNAPLGQPYTLYWVWDWPTAAGSPGEPDGKQELYSTCMDVDITASDGASSQFDVSGFIDQPANNINILAIPQEMSDLNDATAVAAPTEPPSASSNGAVGSGVSVTTGAVLTATAASTAITATPPPAETGSAVTTQAVGNTQSVFTSLDVSTSIDPIPQPSSPGFGGPPGQSTSIQTTFATLTSSTQASSSVAFGGVGQGFSTATVTEYTSVTETMYQTIYPSGFEKRTPTTVSSASTTSTEFQIRGRDRRLLRD